MPADPSSAEGMAAAGATEVKNPSKEQIKAAFDNLESEVNNYINKIAELDQEVSIRSEILIGCLD